ncbi:MAG: CDP-alcohol phosphatidyltransferase family protein [Propionibacteriaceae bacterium]|nr:CDP-alcohol phosphatidyltransferase family protein [Propionibacteriaceae bacterium]
MENQAVGFVRYLPNIASLIRIFGSIALPFLMWEAWTLTIRLPLLGEYTAVPLIWILVFLFLVATDKVDGTLARRLNAKSEFGALLDVIGDALLLVIGVMCCILYFGRDAETTFSMWLNVGLVVIILATKFTALPFAQKFQNTGNLLHSFPHKAFAALAYILVPCMAFTRTTPVWSIFALALLMAYATIDEIVYIVRSADYDVDFKGHGFQKYPLRKSPTDLD